MVPLVIVVFALALAKTSLAKLGVKNEIKINKRVLAFALLRACYRVPQAPSRRVLWALVAQPPLVGLDCPVSYCDVGSPDFLGGDNDGGGSTGHGARLGVAAVRGPAVDSGSDLARAHGGGGGGALDGYHGHNHGQQQQQQQQQHCQPGGGARALLFLIDGIGDVAVPTLNHRTPLQAASVPHLDALAARGVTGLMDPVEPGLACGSDTAHLSLLGYPPREHYRGRGAFECMGAGLEMRPGDVAFKSNFAVLDTATGVVVSRRADRHFEGVGPDLKLPNFPEIEVAVKYATEHRCGVRLRGPGLSDEILGTDPLKDKHLTAAMTAILSAHPINAVRVRDGKPPANCVLLRGGGMRIRVTPFAERHGFARGAFMVAPTCIIAGLGMTVGMDVIPVKGATGDYRSDFMAKVNRAVELIQSDDYDFGFVHFKAVDDAGHDRDVEKKVHFLQLIDSAIGHAVKALDADATTRYMAIVTGDHSTPVLYGDHSHEPVPVVLANLGRRRETAAVDGVTQFDEISVARGCLGRFPGSELMPTLKAVMEL
ncbi:hypothetical protein H9P43_006165 [Blastocladiella emersonii ATCC 22665]|nr:hypothetical protein H9P43_006165 [Blastocladiella emersonii ATCC 22665]